MDMAAGAQENWGGIQQSLSPQLPCAVMFVSASLEKKMKWFGSVWDTKPGQCVDIQMWGGGSILTWLKH